MKDTAQLRTNKQEGTSVEESLLWAGGIARPSPLSALSSAPEQCVPKHRCLFLQAQELAYFQVLGTRRMGKILLRMEHKYKKLREEVSRKILPDSSDTRREPFILTLLYFFISTWAPTLFISDTVIPIHSLQLKTFSSTCARWPLWP